MTSDTPGTTPGTTPDTAVEAPAPAKPPRRRATRKAAAPDAVDTTTSNSSGTSSGTSSADAPAAPEAAAPPVAESAADTPAGPVGEVPPAETDVAPAPARRATRSRRATSAGAAATTEAAAPKRATRSRAAKAAADPVPDPVPDTATDTVPDAAPDTVTDTAPHTAPPTLDVLAELGRTQPAVPEPADEAAVEDADAADGTATDDTAAALDAADPDDAAIDSAAAETTTDAGAAGDGPVVGGRLATTALLFQPPEPTATRPRRRRVVAPAGPPQLVVPEVLVPAQPEPTAPGLTAAEPATDLSEQPAEPRRRSRRATRTTAAPLPVADPVLEPVVEPETDVEAQLAEPPEPAEAAPGRRGSRRRGARAAQVEEPADLEADGEAEEATPAVDGALEPAGEVEVGDTDEDEDETTEGGAPRRRRRRGGRGRRSRSGGEGDGTRPAADAAEAVDAEDSGEADEDEDEDAVGPDAEGDDLAGDAGEGEEGSGTSRRRRRRRRSGRGADTGEAEAEAPSTRTVRAPRPASDEVTALRGSTRLEAKRQRRREGRDAGRRRQIITESEFLARREAVDRTMVVREVDGRTQIAVLEDGVLVEHYVSRQAQVSMAGNVYLGRVQNVLPSMEAAFVDVGKGRNAVLYAGEVNWDAAGLEGQPRRIEQALKSGDSVLVQVTKDPIGHKGARLTSQITLAGRYLVYVPGGGMTGISRKLPDNERARLKKLLREIVPDTAGVIVRTAAEGASEDELRADIVRLQEQWAAIEKKAKTASAPALLQGEPDLAIRVVRDIFNDDFSSLVVQGDEAWQTISGYIGALAPDLAAKVTRWTAEGDVFAAHRVDEQLAKGMDRKVWLPSGGSLVIDRTEAMTVVDVNTGKFTGSGGTLEETVTRNNLEAAEEIVRQLRLRDIGGIIVIDFIDMVLELNRDLVLRRLVECLGRDRTKHQVAEVTSLGLVQMTRKRVGQGLVEAFSETCEHCNGRGFIVHTDPIERGGAPQVQQQTPQPPVGGDASRNARRKRGGAKEPGTGVGSGLPSGLPMVPVLPEAREAVKATLATIAAAAAHAHEHDGHGRAAASAPQSAPVRPDQPAAPVHLDLPSPQTAGDAAQHGGVSDAVTQALAALRLPEPSTPSTDAAGAPSAPVEDGQVTEQAEPAALVDAVIDEAEEAAAEGAASLEVVVEPVVAAGPDAGAESVVDLAPGTVVDEAADAVVDEALELLPVAPEVFDLGDGGDPGEGADPGDGADLGDTGPEPGDPGASDAGWSEPIDGDAPHPADGDADGQ